MLTGRSRWLAVAVVWRLVCGGVGANATETVDYVRHVKPLLLSRCSSCHGPRNQEAQLRLDAGRHILSGSSEGAVVVLGSASRSKLIQRVAAEDAEVRMPPTGPGLSPAEIALLSRWIDGGAAYPTDESVAASPREHWSFQPLRRPPVPTVADRSWPIHDLDRFVLANLERTGWRPNPPAEPARLLRRVFLDVTGLPPTPQEQDAFLASPTRDRYESLVAALLDRDSYGERYARHWLDVARYADSNGYERDAAKPEVWRYRDYVIRALNRDLPFHRFVLEQLAGDELPDADMETMIATGFLRLGPWDDEPADVESDRYDQLDDIVHTTCQVFLGLTMGCARCHDHKFDPLTARDYYSLVAVFNPLVRPRDGRRELTRPAAPPRLVRAREQQDGKAPPTPDYPPGYFLYEEPSSQPPATHVLVRGNPRTLGDLVTPAVPAVLVSRQPDFLPPDEFTSRRRLSFAQWVASPENPLTARVIVNRVWQWHFGEGLVRTPNDFGMIGESPTHPELLDYLAHWFVHDAHWSLKRLHALILTSQTYQMSRDSRADYAEVDPDNRRMWRQSYRRLEVEVICDSMLLASGKLDSQMYGPPVYPFIPREALLHHADKTSIWPAFDEAAASRRLIYAFTKRSLLIPMLEVLDFCDTTRTTPKRSVATVPTQALTLYNGDFVNRQARHLAQRLRREAGGDRVKQVEFLMRLTVCRPPNDAERHAMLQFLADESRTPEPAGNLDQADTVLPRDASGEALAQLCRVILNTNEFVYSD